MVNRLRLIVNFDSFDDLRDGFASTIKSYLQERRSVPGWPEPGKFKIGLAGWSESDNAPDARVVSNASEGGEPAYTPHQVTSKYMTPYDATMIGAAFDLADPARSGADIMERQRAGKWDAFGGGKVGQAIGGFCQYTRIDGNGITVQVARRWAE